jgi:hypothetical protein
MSLALTLLLSGCHSDNIFTSDPNAAHDGDGPAPNITVWPDDIDFGNARVVDDESIERAISIANTGQADLEIFGSRVVETEDSTGFVAGDPASILLPPGAQTELPAWFRPRQYTLADGSIMIDSNDPDDPTVAVAVHGVGIAPAIRIDPDTLDLGMVPYGCVSENTIDVQNIGNDTLVIDQLSFAATSPDIVADNLEPVTLEPGAKTVVTLTYTPTEVDSEMHGVLTALSNDPVQPTAVGTQVGSPGDQIPEEDLFEVPAQPMSDILFVIDNSNSMTPFQKELAENGETFMDALTAKNSDWQVGVVTIDNPSLRGDPITPDLPDPVSAFAYQVQAGTDATTDEYQLYRAWQTLQSPWGDFYWYLRDEASLAIVIVSDERAQDPNVARTTYMSHEDIDYYVDYFYGLKDDDSKVAIDVVGSPPPDGCDPAKEPGRGLDYAVEATDGIFLTICDTDWGPGLASLAAAAVPDLKVFHLSETPVEDTIEVTVDGARSDADTLWFYDESENAVVFHEVPDPESIVQIDYIVLGDCEQ